MLKDKKQKKDLFLPAESHVFVDFEKDTADLFVVVVVVVFFFHQRMT